MSVKFAPSKTVIFLLIGGLGCILFMVLVINVVPYKNIAENLIDGTIDTSGLEFLANLPIIQKITTSIHWLLGFIMYSVIQFLELLPKIIKRDNTELMVLGGAIAGFVVAIIINPLTGVFLGSAIAGTSLINQFSRGQTRMKILHGEASPIGLMDKQELQTYKQLVGDEQFQIELQSVNGSYQLSQDAADLVMQTEVVNQSYGVNPIEQLAMYCRSSCLILGKSGDGKDMLVSNALRAIKQQNPEIRLFVVDPKGIDHESTYYQDVADIFRSHKCGETDDATVVQWFFSTTQEYKQIASNGEQWLLVITEATLIGDCFHRQKDTMLAEFISKIVTAGNASGKNVWMVGQVPNLANLGIDNNGRSQLNVFAVTSKKNVDSAAKQWGRIGVFGKMDTKRLRALCDASPVGRCFYSPNVAEWEPMPKLPNYSGYDRDTHTKITPPISAPSTLESIKIADSTHADVQPSKFATLFNQLEQIETTNIVDALKQIYPGIPNDRLTEIITTITETAKSEGRNALLSKFSL